MALSTSSRNREYDKFGLTASGTAIFVYGVTGSSSLSSDNLMDREFSKFTLNSIGSTSIRIITV